MPSDDLVKRLREYATDWRIRAASNDVVLEAADALEAAARLTPPGDAVEVVARALERARHVIDAYAWPHHKNDPINVPGLTIAAVLTEITEARAAIAALSSIPERAHGEQMREAAAKVCEKFAEQNETQSTKTSLRASKLRRMGDPFGAADDAAISADVLSDCAAEARALAAAIRALPLPPAEERT